MSSSPGVSSPVEGQGPVTIGARNMIFPLVVFNGVISGGNFPLWSYNILGWFYFGLTHIL